MIFMRLAGTLKLYQGVVFNFHFTYYRNTFAPSYRTNRKQMVQLKQVVIMKEDNNEK